MREKVTGRSRERERERRARIGYIYIRKTYIEWGDRAESECVSA